MEGEAAFFSVTKFKSYITGNDFETILYTDHKPLVGMFKNKEPTDKQLANWVLEFSMLKVVVKYEEGRKNVLADALSRLAPLKQTEEPIQVSSITPLMVKFINTKIVKIEGEDYYNDSTSLRKVITDIQQQLELIEKAHNVGHEGSFKTYNRLKRDILLLNWRVPQLSFLLLSSNRI